MHEFQRKLSDEITQKYLSGVIELSDAYSNDLSCNETLSTDVEYVYKSNVTEKTIDIIFDNDKSNTNIKAILKALTVYDACIVCFKVNDLMDAHYLIDSIDSDNLNSLPIGVITYDRNYKVVCLRSFTLKRNEAVKRTENEWKSYWCWWRDASQYEIATLLRLSDEYDKESGDIYTDKVYPKFYDMMISGETKMWDGHPRKRQYSTASFKAEKQNYKIPMVQLGLWEAATGHITAKGRNLLKLIDEYGANSAEYFNCLAKIILIDGKHLDLVKDLDDFQRNCREIIPATSSEFFVLFDCYMSDKRSLGTRKPSAVKTGAKKAYVRDEPKLWNKLGIIKTIGETRYYIPFVGLTFDWDRINEILLSSAL